jgi:hypothetical protein
VSRQRRPEDWDRDLAGARDVEGTVAAALAADRRVVDLRDDTAAFDRLDFSFRYRGLPVALDVKEKRQRYSTGIRTLWPGLTEPDLFIVDETVYRRIVWQGGGGYLAVHDVPGRRWVVLGPWELTLGHKERYGRWGERGASPFLKGKLLFDLSIGEDQPDPFDVGLVLRTIDQARRWRDRVEPYPIHGARLRELGR